MAHDLIGTPVSEEEAAISLGFGTVHEMHQWETEMGQKVAKLEHELQQAIDDGEGFRWHGRRMQRVLEKVVDFMSGAPNVCVPPACEILHAANVVLGREVDWDEKLKGWFDDVQSEIKERD